MKDYEDFTYKKNKKIAYFRGLKKNKCSDCGFRLCTCQMKLTEFEGRFHSIMEVIINRANGSHKRIKTGVINMCHYDTGFKDFCIRHNIIK